MSESAYDTAIYPAILKYLIETSLVQYKKNGYIKRPSNAFMIFKSLECNGSGLTLKEIGKLWHSLSSEERRPYRQLEEHHTAHHQTHFPDYKFHPKHGKNREDKPKTTRGKPRPVPPHFPRLLRLRIEEFKEKLRFRKTMQLSPPPSRSTSTFGSDIWVSSSDHSLSSSRSPSTASRFRSFEKGDMTMSPDYVMADSLSAYNIPVYDEWWSSYGSMPLSPSSLLDFSSLQFGESESFFFDGATIL
ncbi:hypothetical protein C8J56DRAFT_1116824 [Mycena floridula]|nr:hypothetical protein C8J56DRAFT_1116824 [Mycena floridula]